MAQVETRIQDFYRVAGQRDFSRDFQFRVLNISVGAASGVSFEQTDDLVYCTAASLPAREITNVAVPYMGLNFNVPGNATYPDSQGYTLQFYCDQNSRIRQKFEDISFDIFDDSTSTGNYLTPPPNAVIDLVQLDTQLNKVSLYKLYGASVRNVGPIEYNIGSGTGTVVTFSATMSYHYFRRTETVRSIPSFVETPIGADFAPAI